MPPRPDWTPRAWRRALTGADSLDAVVELEQQGYRMGIQGVPFFIVMGKYGVSGAQPPELWRDALPKIAAEAESRPACRRWLNGAGPRTRVMVP